MVRRAVPPAKPTSTTVPISIDELAGEALFGEEASELLGGLDGTDGRQLLSISKADRCELDGTTGPSAHLAADRQESKPSAAALRARGTESHAPS